MKQKDRTIPKLTSMRKHTDQFQCDKTLKMIQPLSNTRPYQSIRENRRLNVHGSRTKPFSIPPRNISTPTVSLSETCMRVTRRVLRSSTPRQMISRLDPTGRTTISQVTCSKLRVMMILAGLPKWNRTYYHQLDSTGRSFRGL